MSRAIWIAVAALILSDTARGYAHGSRARPDVIRNLDLTSFPNSVGPRRIPGKTTFADYDFVLVDKTAGGARLLRTDRSWEMRFIILSAGPKRLQLCFYDSALAGPGQTFRPTYRATSALLVTKAPRGHWSARQVTGGFPKCRNDPEEHRPQRGRARA